MSSGVTAHGVAESGTTYDGGVGQITTHHRRRDIQGLRTIAVGLVVANHVTNHPVGGFVGVDVFFVISGYLITGLLLREHRRSSRISIADFYARRVRRIIPLALLVLVTTDIGAKVAFTGTRAHQTVTDSVWALLFGANIHFSRIGTNYFDLTRPDSPVQHFWSLAVEEQFYVVWPAALIGALWVCSYFGFDRRTVVGWLLVVIVVCSYVWCIRTTDSSPTQAYFSTPARAWELGLGALLAVAAPNVQRLPKFLRGAAGWAGAGLLVLCVLAINASGFPGAIAALPVLASILILASGEGETPAWGIGSRGLIGSGLFVYLGDISYSLYLWHWPVLTIGKALVSDSRLHQLMFVVIALAISSASYRFIEKPILDSTWLMKEHRSRAGRELPSRIDSGIIAAATAVIVFAIAAYEHNPSDGAPVTNHLSQYAAATTVVTAASATTQAALTAKIIASLSATKWTNLEPPLASIANAGAPEWFQDKCLDVNTVSDVSRCTYGPANAPHRVVVIGDSFAMSYVPGIREALPATWRITVLTEHECLNADISLYIKGVEESACDAHHAFEFAEIAKIKPDAIIMADAAPLIGDIRAADDASREQMVTAGLRDTLSRVAPYTKKITVLSSPPSSGNLQNCVTRFSSPSACTRQVQVVWHQFSAAEQAAVGTAATYVDTSPWFCAGDECPAVIGSTPVSIDGGHLTQAYSQQLAPLLASVLQLAP